MIISQARNGELKSLSAKDKTDEVIVDYVNIGLIALYNRFMLKSVEVIVALQDLKMTYKLDGTDNDVTVNGLPVEEGTLIKLLGAFNEAGAVSINNEYDEYSVFTPSYDSIQVPFAISGDYLSLVYKVFPDLVSYNDDGNGNAEDTDVRLPLTLLEPLLHYIGYRAHGSLDGNINAESNTHLMRFEASCKRVEELGVVPTDSVEMDANGSTRGMLLS